MKKKLLLLFLLGCGLFARAQSTLVVEQTDGKQSTFLLAENPVMTVSGTDCVFRSETAELTVSCDLIRDFHFTDQPTALVSASADGVHAKIIAPGTVLIRGVEAKDVRIFDLSGREAKAGVSGTKDALTVSLTSLPKVVYVLRFAAYSLKFTNK